MTHQYDSMSALKRSNLPDKQPNDPTITSPCIIEQFYDFLNHEQHGVTELVVIDPNERDRIKIGYFDNREDFIEACTSENGNGNIYACVNPCPREYIERAPNELRRLPSRIKTKDIHSITAIPLDIDPERPANTPSTQSEMERAVGTAQEIVKDMEDEGICARGQARIMMTGNGCHILIPIPPIEVTDENRAEIIAQKKEFEQMIKDRYSKENIKIDSIHDLPRLIKVIGTQSIKGEDTPERPHRLTYPITNMERHESNELRQHILNIDIAPAPETRSDNPLEELPTVEGDPPCDMCKPARNMWNAKSVEDRSGAVQQSALERFEEYLPNNPYCSEDKQLDGPLDKNDAINYPYIQVNFPNIRYVVFDLDYDGSVSAASEQEIPEPTLTAINKENGHCHYLYELLYPLPRKHSRKTGLLLGDVVASYKDMLRADKCITSQRQLVKNPLHNKWTVIDSKNNSGIYTLSEMAEYISDEWKKARNNAGKNMKRDARVRSFEETLDPGSRTLSLFENGRYYAYSITCKCSSEEELYGRVLEWIEELNDKVT